MKTIYFIEGNISSGKSTLVQNLESKGYNVYQEPVNDWRTKYIDSDGKNILELFYEDDKYSFQFEILVMITRWSNILRGLRSDADVVIFERCLDTDAKVFAKNLYNTGRKTGLDWQIYQEWYETFRKEIEHHFEDVHIEYIYLVTPPDECHSRISQRGRNEESLIPIDYLKSLHELHEDWFSDIKHNIHRIDGTLSPEEVLKHTEEAIETRSMIRKSVL